MLAGGEEQRKECLISSEKFEVLIWVLPFAPVVSFLGFRVLIWKMRGWDSDDV